MFVLEVNPRASRTVPFVSKSIGVPLAKLAAKVMAGKKLSELGFTKEIWTRYWAVKESVFPFNRFHGQDILLSPEMRSTGEVMGLDADLGIAYAKSLMAAGAPLPLTGRVFISVSDAHKRQVAAIARQFVDLGFEIVSTAGTAKVLSDAGLKVSRVYKLSEGRPNALDLLKNREIQLVINTPAGQTPRADEIKIRTSAVYTGTPIMTTLSGARAAALGIAALKKSGYAVQTLQEYRLIAPPPGPSRSSSDVDCRFARFQPVRFGLHSDAASVAVGTHDKQRPPAPQILRVLLNTGHVARIAVAESRQRSRAAQRNAHAIVRQRRQPAMFIHRLHVDEHNALRAGRHGAVFRCHANGNRRASGVDSIFRDDVAVLQHLGGQGAGGACRARENGG